MEIVSTVALLMLVALFVLFVARWRPHLRPLPAPPLALDEVPIAAPTGESLARDASERDVAMREALRASGRIPKRQWREAEPSLLFVHDDLTEDDLARLLERLEIPRRPETETSPEEGSAREQVRVWVADHDEDKLERLGTHYAPGPFDAYRLRPPETGGIPRR